MIQYKAGYKYQLVADYSIRIGIFPAESVCEPFLCLDRSGLLTIRAGYAWNGASGPAVDTDTFMRGSLVHDALYQLMGSGLLSKAWRETADNLLRDICVDAGMGSVRAWYVHRAVRTMGGSYTTENPVLTAP